jgi:hypothetical protein
MTTRESPHFTPVSLAGHFNAQRGALPVGLQCPPRFAERYGRQVIRGMPFLFGEAGLANVVLLDSDEVSVDLDGARASYLLVVHVVEESADMSYFRFDLEEGQGYGLGGVVSEYELMYEDGSTVSTPVLRRFAIQQARCGWGSAPFACVPAAEDRVIPLADEALAVGNPVDPLVGLIPTRAIPGLVYALMPSEGGLLWVYALVNPKQESPLEALVLRPREERSAVYALALTGLTEHPLRPSARRKLRLPLPDGVQLNAIGEVDQTAIGIDLGVVISARAVLEYDRDRWHSEEAIVEPARSERDVVVEVAAHPQARLYVGDDVYELSVPASGLIEVGKAERPVRLRFVDKETASVVAVRLHIHGEAGEYLPPRGHHRKVNQVWHQDSYAEFATVENQYAYVDGECVVDLPLGSVYVEISRGYEIAPIRTSVVVGPETEELVFELERVLRWRERGWVTADTHVHFLSPQTALLEGQAEGVNVVNLLASQWGEMFSNVGDFDGNTTFGADDLGGRGEFLVRVGSENRMQVLGHISLLGYGGQLIHPLCTGGPDESALGDPLEVTMAEWAQRCIDQGGLVVMPHAPTPQLERAADIVLGLVNAIELMNMNPLKGRFSHPALGVVEAGSPLNPYGIADWYRYLSLGYHVPLVGGSDKMAASALLGGIRTYAQLRDGDLTYANWMEAVRRGNTFVTVGPLTSLTVEGVEPGGRLQLPVGGGTVQVQWQVESLRVPIEAVEIVVGGMIEDITSVGGMLTAQGHADIQVSASTWVALRVRGSYHGNREHIAAHTSAVQVLVEGSELFSETDSMAVLDQIQGAIAYVDTIAPRPEMRRFQELRATLETAYNRLHQRMHAAGVYHAHQLHDPAQPHEH